MERKPITTSTIRQMKEEGTPISMITAYDYAMARNVDEAGIDMILVGDSLGNVMLGYSSTLPVTMDAMVHHTQAVVRGTKTALVVADMPFMSYQASEEEGLRNAGRLMKEGGSAAVKIEGGAEVCQLVKKMVTAGIPVVGHIGLTPQSVNQFGGFKVQGKDFAAAQKLLDDAKALEAAGAFAVVLECVPAALAKKVTEQLTIPTIGIGAGNGCSGQVLVCNDLLGFSNGFSPKFAKKYRNLHDEIVGAVSEYISDVRDRSFPGPEHSFKIDEEVLEKLY
ncbi:MAG: 3-methyl-2-oxobutanoate hydroxymethyltransferase [Acholeplasmataceae bacterium]|nr:3-methyl-2-oxobutanoate hydroxymethyltransferase [Acidaminococcaceae bacterium]NLY84558.1 3-methyl-2-oxobutanoate hydroxymethyltransferase [Acholeplasmataceae bacterium]